MSFTATDSCRVRVAVRLRPNNSEDLALGADFDSCVELQPEVSLSIPFYIFSFFVSNHFKCILFSAADCVDGLIFCSPRG